MSASKGKIWPVILAPLCFAVVAIPFLAASKSNLQTHSDSLTGCQYLESPRGGLTPRLDHNGNHICTKPAL